MKKMLLTATAIVAVGAFALTGCSSERGGGDTGSGDTGSETAKGFAADATIGVALPDKTSENWVLAGKLFEDGLAKAGFKADVQYAPASNTVAEQQNQIQAMVTGGAKVIIIGAKDGKQLSTQVEAAKEAGAYVIAYDRLIENTEAHIRRHNPIARIASLTEEGDTIRVLTISCFLAERIGKELEKAYGGKLDLQRLDREDFVRVRWSRPK